jgi:hypothetical protein
LAINIFSSLQVHPSLSLCFDPSPVTLSEAGQEQGRLRPLAANGSSSGVLDRTLDLKSKS